MSNVKFKNLCIALGLVSLLLTGCFKAEKSEINANPQEQKVEAVNSYQTVEEIAESAPPVLSEELVKEDTGLIYSFQISDDPIPEDLVPLGGSRQGSVFAFPSRIKLELFKRRIANNPELKAECERMRDTTLAYLREKYGEDFILEDLALYEPSILEEDAGKYTYDYIGSPVANPDFKFYGNTGYTTSGIHREKLFFRDEYQSDIIMKEYREEILAEINRIFTGDTLVQVFCNVITENDVRNSNFNLYSNELEKRPIMVFYINVFGDGEVDKIKEQEKILRIWIERCFKKNVRGSFDIHYWPPQYKEVIQQRIEGGERCDWRMMQDPDKTQYYDQYIGRELLKDGELRAFFTSGQRNGELHQLKIEMEEDLIGKESRYWY